MSEVQINQLDQDASTNNQNQDTYFYDLNIPDGYKFIKNIAKGSYGYVFLVKKINDGSVYVIKNIPTMFMSENEKRQSQKEYIILKKLTHPHIIKFKEARNCIQKHMIQIVMEYAEGGDLHQKIQRQKNIGKLFSEEKVLDWFIQICLALEHLHTNKIIHRDIKPKNIFLTQQNCIKLGDFGVSKELEYTKQLLSSKIGTPYYVAPEVFGGLKYSYEADIWSLGVVLYELCCLQPPFKSWDQESLYFKTAKKPYPPITHQEYSNTLKTLVSKLLIKSQNGRYTLKQILNEPIIYQRRKQLQENTEQKRNYHPPQDFRYPSPQKPQFPKKDQLLSNLQQQSPFIKPTQQHKDVQQEKLKAINQQNDKDNINKQNLNFKDVNNQNLQNKNNQQNALRPDSSAKKLVQKELKNQSVDNERKNFNLFSQNQKLNKQEVNVPIKYEQKPNNNILNTNPFQSPNSYQAQQQNKQLTPLNTLNSLPFLQIKQQGDLNNDTFIPSPIPSFINSKQKGNINDINKVEIKNQNVCNQIYNQASSSSFIKHLDTLKTQNSSHNSLTSTFQSIQEIDNKFLSNKDSHQNIYSTHQDKNILTKCSIISQKNIDMLNQRSEQYQNDEDTSFISSINYKLIQNQELNEQENKKYHFKQDLKIETPDQNSQNLQKQSQQDEANKFTNNYSNQSTQKIKETILQKQETKVNSQNLYEYNIEDAKYLGIPGGDFFFETNKFDKSLAEQNKKAGIEQRVDFAQKGETKNEKNKKNMVENHQNVQYGKEQSCQIQEEISGAKQYTQTSKIQARAISRSKFLGNTEKQNIQNEINKNSLQQTDQIPKTPIKNTDQKHLTTQLKNNFLQSSTSCQLFTSHKSISTYQSSQQKHYQEQLNEKNEDKTRFPKIFFESGQKEIKQAHQSKQSPQKPSCLDIKQENNQKVRQVDQLSQQYSINSQESPRSNQFQKQFGDKSEQQQQQLSYSFDREIQEDIDPGQYSDEESKNKINTKVDQNQNKQTQNICISQSRPSIKTNQTYPTQTHQNNQKNQLQDDEVYENYKQDFHQYDICEEEIEEEIEDYEVCENYKQYCYQYDICEEEIEEEIEDYEDLEQEDENNYFPKQKSQNFNELKLSLQKDMTPKQFELFYNTVKSEIKKSYFQNKTQRGQIKVLQERIPQIQLDKLGQKVQQFIDIVNTENKDVEIENL
ncbi:hypothetical protein ABPG72_002470 [Tetrahymena utriculariae]